MTASGAQWHLRREHAAVLPRIREDVFPRPAGGVLIVQAEDWMSCRRAEEAWCGERGARERDRHGRARRPHRDPPAVLDDYAVGRLVVHAQLEARDPHGRPAVHGEPRVRCWRRLLRHPEDARVPGGAGVVDAVFLHIVGAVDVEDTDLRACSVSTEGGR